MIQCGVLLEGHGTRTTICPVLPKTHTIQYIHSKLPEKLPEKLDFCQWKGGYCLYQTLNRLISSSYIRYAMFDYLACCELQIHYVPNTYVIIPPSLQPVKRTIF